MSRVRSADTKPSPPRWSGPPGIRSTRRGPERPRPSRPPSSRAKSADCRRSSRRAVAECDPRAGGNPPRRRRPASSTPGPWPGVNHVGIGGGYDGCADLPGVSTIPRLFAALLERGGGASDCAKVAGRNVLRVLRAAEDAAAARS
ncbi:membrane dipeptidase [Actinokineospora sp. NPDC004072]